MPLAQYVQELQRSSVAGAYLMSCSEILGHPQLQRFVRVPQGLIGVLGDESH